MFNIGDLVICKQKQHYSVTDIDVVCKIVNTSADIFDISVTPIELLNEKCSCGFREDKERAIKNKIIYPVRSEYFKLYKKKKSTNVK